MSSNVVNCLLSEPKIQECLDLISAAQSVAEKQFNKLDSPVMRAPVCQEEVKKYFDVKEKAYHALKAATYHQRRLGKLIEFYLPLYPEGIR